MTPASARTVRDAGDLTDPDPARPARDDRIERDTAKADQANGEGDAVNDTEARDGKDESPA